MNSDLSLDEIRKQWYELDNDFRENIMRFAISIRDLSFNRDNQCKYVEQFQKQINDMKLEYQTKENEKDNMINKFMSLQMNDKVNIQEQLNQFNVQNSEVLKYIKGLQNKSPNEKGLEGELEFDAIVQECVGLELEIIDTSALKGNGDRILQNKDVKIMVEVKNVERRTIMSKFNTYKEQLRVDLENNSDNINVGILAVMPRNTCLRSNKKLEIINVNNGKHIIIAIADIQSNTFLVDIAIRLAIYMTNVLNNLYSDNDKNAINEVVRSCSIIEKLLIHLKKNKKLIKDLENSTNDIENTLVEVLGDFKLLIEN